jgi:protein-S-isoprenylcysteine O-methyltransferase Ste14
MKLFINALVKFVLGIVLVCLLVFLPAGTLSYFNGWLFICLLFIPMFVFGIYLFVKKPKLLERRLNSKEKVGTQKLVVLVSALLFIAGFIVCGLDYRYGWTCIPNYVVIISGVTLLIGYALYIEVMRENEYLLRTIEVEKEQKLIDTGLYGVVRHPMYLSVILLFLSFPLVLGSLYGFYIFLVFPLVLVIRLHSEEKVLVRELKGYSKYKLRVKYKLIPYIW